MPGSTPVAAPPSQPAFEVALELSGHRLTVADVPVGADAAGLFTALQEQLGLKLEPSTGPMDVLVIDAVERPTPD